MQENQLFAQAVGQWSGAAEVYDGNGTFLGYASDRRQVQRVDDGKRLRIDLSFVGPFSFNGHYFIEDHGPNRLYQGPANCGFAETLAPELVDANAYWPLTGLTQRFMLYILPGGQKQLSLALMSRGEQLLYTVVGENTRVVPDALPPPLPMLNGTAYDRRDDPNAGRGASLLHRPGMWSGTLSAVDASLEPLRHSIVSQSVSLKIEKSQDIRALTSLKIDTVGGCFDSADSHIMLHSNGHQAWSELGDVVGSYSLWGGRALSGVFHHLSRQLRVWRREVVAHDGTYKVVLNLWYRGGVRVGVEYGVLTYQPPDAPGGREQAAAPSQAPHD